MGKIGKILLVLLIGYLVLVAMGYWHLPADLERVLIDNGILSEVK